MLDTVEWDLFDADLEVFCDSTLTTMGFYCPACNASLFSAVLPSTPHDTIFFYEALCVLSALLWASELPTPPTRLLSHTDSLDMVEMFHSLKALERYSDLLLFAVRILLSSHISLRVFHIDGINNIVADALSRTLFDVALTHHPGPLIRLFQPPLDVLGAAQR